MTERRGLTRNRFSRHEQLSVYDPDEGSLEGRTWRLFGGSKNAAVVGVDLPDSVMSTLSTPNTEGGPCVCRLTAIAVLNIRPGAAAYGVTPAHVAIQKRDNAVSFAFWRSEPNRILCVLKYQPSLRVLSFDSAIRRFLIVTSIWLRREEQRAPWQQRSSRKSCLEHLK